jgi:cholesterol transport system auxiliary component
MKAASMIRSAILLSSLLLAGGCSVLPQPVAPGMLYDFGPAPQAAGAGPRIDKAIVLHDAVAPSWLDGAGIHYRLLQSSPAQLRSYANSRWVMPPAALFTNRLKSRLADSSRGTWSAGDGLRADLTLRIDVEEFAQWFDGPAASRAVVRVRASLSAGREPAQQKSFSVERPAATPDAAGGVAALTAASDDAVAQIVEWVAAQKR